MAIIAGIAEKFKIALFRLRPLPGFFIMGSV